MVNKDTGRTRTTTFCGIHYTVLPGIVDGGKQWWTLMVDGAEVTTHIRSLSRATGAIHRHAVDTGAYAAMVAERWGKGESLEEIRLK